MPFSNRDRQWQSQLCHFPFEIKSGSVFFCPFPIKMKNGSVVFARQKRTEFSSPFSERDEKWERDSSHSPAAIENGGVIFAIFQQRWERGCCHSPLADVALRYSPHFDRNVEFALLLLQTETPPFESLRMMTLPSYPVRGKEIRVGIRLEKYFLPRPQHGVVFLRLTLIRWLADPLHSN